MPSFDLPIPSLFRRGPRAVVGMDIGTDAVRLAMVERSGGEDVVRWVEEISLTALQGFADYDSVESLLSEILRHRIDGRVEVAAPPPWSSARIAVQEFPAMEEARFQKAAHWHFQRNRPEDMDRPLNHAISQPARTSGDGQQHMDGIMVSMDEVMLEGLEQLCSTLRMRLRAVLPQPTCYLPLVRQQFGPEHSVLSVDVGAGQTRVTMIVDGSVRLVRRIKPCANDVVRHVCDAAGLSWEEANHALLAHSGLGPLAEDDPEGIAARASGAIETALDRLAHLLTGEIERSIAYIDARHTESVDRVVLTGGLAGSPHVLAELQSAVSHPIEILRPLAEGATEVDVPENARVHFDLAVGAAMLALREGDRYNILASQDPEESGGRSLSLGPLQGSSRVVAASAVAGLLLAGLGHDIHRHRQNNDLAERIAVSEERLERLGAEADSLGNQRNLFALADRIEALRSIYDERHLYTPFISRVVALLPEGVWLDQIQLGQREVEIEAAIDQDDSVPSEPRVEKRHHIRVVGHSHVVDTVGDLVLVLEQRRLMEEIRVLNIREAKDEDASSRFRFEIEGEPRVPRRGASGHALEEVAR